jgi:CheY-like chemotaxis protein
MTGEKILAIDDEEFNLDILNDYLDDAGYSVVTAGDGLEGLEKLRANPDVSVIVLDRMMPRMDGMAFLKEVKADPQFKDIPVIMQTAAASLQQMSEGIKAGVYYYLTKPYEDEMLLGIVRSAIADAKSRAQMREEVLSSQTAIGLMRSANFEFRTLEEAKNLATFIANCFPDPQSAVLGLYELMLNAIEHGNLAIKYDEKTDLVMAGKWYDEVMSRIDSPDYSKRFATLTYEMDEDNIIVVIKDQGEGFNWEKYLEISPERAMDPHGRGIATSKMLSFDDLQYMGKGNEVMCRVKRQVMEL